MTVPLVIVQMLNSQSGRSVSDVGLAALKRRSTCWFVDTMKLVVVENVVGTEIFHVSLVCTLY